MKPPSYLRRSAACLAAAIVLVVAPAAANEPESDATHLFDESVALMREGRHADAIPKLEESQRLAPGTGTQFNLAICYMRTGRLGSAWRNFVEVERLARSTGKEERAEAASAKLAELRPIVPSLKLRVEAPGDVDVTVDTVRVRAADRAFVPVDPGPHRVEATAPAKLPWRTTVEAPPAATALEVVVPRLTEIAPAASPPPPVSAPSGRRTAAWIAGGAGIGGVVVAGVSGVMLLSAKSTADDHCTGGCDATGSDAVDRMRTLVPINAVAWGAAILGLGVGGVLFATSGGPRAKAVIASDVAADRARVELRVRF